ncbi:hypothetical protein G3N55_02915 [Dissulfurirhabdus thermomarina]|uniref:Mannose-1-phosphate guanyltransferase C-terminal domain-containing protein n=1 Tax=Dissulfurirhabdus thermomarina TaxID=1765737 RepID=A0A6N9TKN5_DISTH|nr:hypothetical protein [Dissulfurirhabdus thermomarina]NDY41805.1 hypothetical protein [Dissulfurirhabdus thermomarina]NMX24054.1 hypothetical protein [Dissulfurirhabdus thermomarina]
MNTGLAAADYFARIPPRWAALFDGEGPVWAVLDRLGAFLADQVAGNLGPAVRPGVPLDRPLVLAPGGPVEGRVEVRCADAAKGRLEVAVDGRVVPGASLLSAGAVFAGADVEIGRGVLVEPGAFVAGPTLVGDHTEIRQGAYIRGHCLVGTGCVVGHATEVKHAVFLDGAKAGHFAYVGDSLLGNDVNLGAGTKLANLRFTPGNVRLRHGGRALDTGRRKFGAVLGDGVQTGCNAVTSPGTLLGPGAMVLPNVTVRSGVYPPRHIAR